MKDPADSVVDELGFRKGLVTTFVSNDPEAGCWQAGGESIERPERIIENRVESRMRQRARAECHTSLEVDSRNARV